MQGAQAPAICDRGFFDTFENINGSGPGGLKDDEILLEAKIIGVADVVEAMSSHLTVLIDQLSV